MVLKWLQAVILGAVQGISGVLPLSGSGFTSIARRLLGLPLDGSADRFFSAVLCILIALVILITLRKDWLYAFQPMPRKRNSKATPAQIRAALSKRMVFLMFFGLVISLPGLVLERFIAPWQTRFMRLSLLMILGGLLTFTCDRVGHGKRAMAEATVKDAFLVGLFQLLGTVPGLSPVGLGIVMTVWLGMEPSFGIRFSCLMLVPGMILRGIAGILMNLQSVNFSLSWIPGAIACVIFTYLSLRLLRYVAQRRTLGEFSLPIWGAALFSFLLYLFN